MPKHKTTGFWISLTSSIVLVCNVIGNALGFTINSELISNLVTAICGVLVMVGVLIPTKQGEVKTNENNQTENKDNNLDENNNL